MNINLDVISWQWSIIILLFILFFIYLFFGGGEYEYLGLSPLEIGFDASRHVKHSDKSEREAEVVSSEPIDNTPHLPDLSKIPMMPKKPMEMKNRFRSSSSMSFDSFSVGDLVESIDESEESEIPGTPGRGQALGGYACRTNGFISKGEKLCKQALEEIYGKPFYCVRPDFLKNPETGRNLELDLFNAELGIGCEYDGKQHFQYPNSYHKTYEDFINTVRRDQFKVDTCDANGVYLITVPYNVPLTLEAIKKYITYYLPENAHERQS